MAEQQDEFCFQESTPRSTQGVVLRVSLTGKGDFSNYWEAFQQEGLYRYCNGPYDYLEGDVI